MNERDLLKLKEKIDTAKNRAAELRGVNLRLNQELWDNWQCKTVKDAQHRLDKLTSELQELSNKINEKSQALTEALESIESNIARGHND